MLSDSVALFFLNSLLTAISFQTVPSPPFFLIPRHTDAVSDRSMSGRVERHVKNRFTRKQRKDMEHCINKTRHFPITVLCIRRWWSNKNGGIYIHRKDKWNLSNITFRHAILAWHTKDNARHLFHPYRGQREKQMTTLNTLLSRYASRFPNAFFFSGKRERLNSFSFCQPFLWRGGGDLCL